MTQFPFRLGELCSNHLIAVVGIVRLVIALFDAVQVLLERGRLRFRRRHHLLRLFPCRERRLVLLEGSGVG